MKIIQIFFLSFSLAFIGCTTNNISVNGNTNTNSNSMWGGGGNSGGHQCSSCQGYGHAPSVCPTRTSGVCVPPQCNPSRGQTLARRSAPIRRQSAGCSRCGGSHSTSSCSGGSRGGGYPYRELDFNGSPQLRSQQGRAPQIGSARPSDNRPAIQYDPRRQMPYTYMYR